MNGWGYFNSYFWLVLGSLQKPSAFVCARVEPKIIGSQALKGAPFLKKGSIKGLINVINNQQPLLRALLTCFTQLSFWVVPELGVGEIPIRLPVSSGQGLLSAEAKYIQHFHETLRERTPRQSPSPWAAGLADGG